jgi:SET domain-containing protein
LADNWISCPPEEKCQACVSKFKPLKDSQVVIKASKIHGKGLFLRKAVKADTVIALVKGRRSQKDPKNATPYTMEIGNRYVQLDPPVMFINQSCRPNCRFEKWCSGDEDKEEVAIVSDTCIKPNKELTIQYCSGKPFPYIDKCTCDICAGKKRL